MLFGLHKKSGRGGVVITHVSIIIQDDFQETRRLSKCHHFMQESSKMDNTCPIGQLLKVIHVGRVISHP